MALRDPSRAHPLAHPLGGARSRIRVAGELHGFLAERCVAFRGRPLAHALHLTVRSGGGASGGGVSGGFTSHAKDACKDCTEKKCHRPVNFFDKERGPTCREQKCKSTLCKKVSEHEEKYRDEEYALKQKKRRANRRGGARHEREGDERVQP